MTLNEFLKELKHKSIILHIYDNKAFVCGCTLSTFEHWTQAPKYINKKIDIVKPLNKILQINLKGGEE